MNRSGTTDDDVIDWEAIQRDPDPEEDLGYEMVELEVFEAEDDSGRYMVLPMNEDMIADDAFIVASPDSVCNVVDRI